jgi:hypothetical protein
MYIFGILVVTLIILVCASSASLYCIWALVQVREKLKSNLTVAVIAAALANLQYLATASLVMFNALTFPTGFITFAGPDDRFPDRITKQQIYGTVHILMLAVAYTLATVAMFFLLGVWASIAMRFNQMSPAQGRIVERVCIAYGIFALAMFIPTCLIYSIWIVNGLIAAFVGSILTIGFAVVGVKVRRIAGYIRTEKAESSQTTVVSSTRVLLRRIYLVSFVLSILLAFAVITLAIYGIGPYRRQTYILPAFVDAPREICYRLAFLFCAMVDAVVTLYLTLTVSSRLRGSRANQSPSSAHSESPLADQGSPIAAYQHVLEGDTT